MALIQLSCSFPSFAAPSKLPFSIISPPKHTKCLRLISSPQAAISSSVQGSYDPVLREVLELATDTELYELHRILFGPSYFSPLIKSIMNKTDMENFMIEDLEERDGFIEALESRFLFLAADARSTLRGWRPSYRNVLLSVIKKLNISCSRKLTTQDLEAEIFLHILQDYSSDELENSKDTKVQNSLEVGISQWKIQALSAVQMGESELQSLILKGSSLITLAKIYQLMAKNLSGKLFLEAANYQIKKEALKKAGQLAAINLESRAALLAAKQGFAGAASRYVGLRSLMGFLGPVMWGTFLADIVIQMLGTDYARILRAIFAFAQIRITRTYNLPFEDD